MNWISIDDAINLTGETAEQIGLAILSGEITERVTLIKPDGSGGGERQVLESDLLNYFKK